MTATIRQLDPGERSRQEMLDHIDHLRARIEAGELRALFTVQIPTDIDGPHHTWDGGDLTHAEAIGWLEQIKFRLQLRAYEVVQRGHLELPE